MKKFLLLVFFSLLTLISTRYFFHEGVPVTHDGNNHLIRFANYKIAIRELQFPPRFAPNLVNGYGYPVFNYNYPLANILSLPFSILNWHYESTFKVVMTLAVFLSFVGAYLFLREKQFSRMAKFFSLLVFGLNPYVLTSIIFRGNIGEIMALGILPWIFYLLEKIKKSETLFDKNFFLLNIFLTALLLSHNITAFFACILLIFYSFFNYFANYEAWKKLGLNFLWAFANSLWFWLPAIMEKELIVLDNVDLTINYYRHFPSLAQLLRLPIHFGYSYWGNVDSMSFGLGAIQLIVFFIAIIYFFKKRTKENLVFFLALMVLFLGQLQIFRPLYDLIPFADFIQFPWRLALLFSIVLLPIAAVIYQNSNKFGHVFLILVAGLQLLQFLQVKPIDYHHKNPIDYDADGGTTSVNQENMPKTFNFAFFETKKDPVFILHGKGQVTVKNFFGSKRHYALDLEETSTIIESTAFFPGWETKINGQKIKYLDDLEIQGRIAYQLPTGKYEVESRFTQNTWPRLVGNTLSAVGLTAWLVSLIFFRTSKRTKIVENN